MGRTFSPLFTREGQVSFEFRRQGIVWLEDTSVSPSEFHRLHTSKDISFSQTFRQTSTQKRTLHDLNNLFEGSVINEANPADFSFVLLMVNDSSPKSNQHKPLDLLLEYSGNSYRTFNLYFVYEDYSPSVYYKVENCVFTGGTFNMPTKGILTVSLSGQGSRLVRQEGAFTGTDSTFYANANFIANTAMEVTVGSDVLDNILGASLEIQNNIEWTANNTIQSSLSATNASNSSFPSSFTLTGRRMGGSIRQYISKSTATSTSNLQTWKENTTVRIQAGDSDYLLDVNMSGACNFTNRAGFDEVFTQNYDYRVMVSPTSLKNYFTY